MVDYTDLFTKKLAGLDIIKIIGTDLLSLTLMKNAKEMGADIAYGNS